MATLGNELGSEQVEAQTHLYRLMFNYMTSMALTCATHLAIPDKIQSHGKPITLPELVSALHLHPKRTPKLQQLMRLLVLEGLFAKTKVNKEEAYDLTPSSRLLLRGIGHSFAGHIMGHVNPMTFKAWHAMADWFVAEETTPFETAYGMPFFDFISRSSDDLLHFNEAMDSDSKVFNSSILGLCLPVFEGLDTLVDVAGGAGALSKNISKAYPQLKCTVLDLPNVVANLSGTENLQYVGGDMLKSIPPADGVLMKCILHNWGDEDCVKILSNCKASISASGKRSGKVVVIDAVVNGDISGDEEDESTKVKLYMDMLMLVMFNGKERTEKEWKSLFMKAGFSDYKITPLPGFRSLIEVFP